MKRMVGRNNYKVRRFIIEVTLSWNRKKGTIDNDNELYQIYHTYNEKYTKIVVDMNIITLNVMNLIKTKLLKDDIKDVTAKPDVEP